jgi:hypothetical protein
MGEDKGEGEIGFAPLTLPSPTRREGENSYERIRTCQFNLRNSIILKESVPSKRGREDYLVKNELVKLKPVHCHNLFFLLTQDIVFLAHLGEGSDGFVQMLHLVIC